MSDQDSLFRVNDLKGFLQGVWWLSRKLDDRRAGQQGQLTGSAVFSPSGDDLHYSEKGRLLIGDHDGAAHQTYRYAFPEAGRAAVHFGDGRLFHELDLSGGRWSCTHLCDPDRYEGSFTVLGPDSWRVVWRVEGPRKDLTLDSTYRRAL